MDIATKRFILTFEIGEHYAMLKLNDTNDNIFKNFFDKILNVKMAPGQLLNKLIFAGINILPEDND